ncbi:MAG TPA: ribonuclease HII [Candidatus Paceibacterota bacterium]|jgi:ribonuclease HII|nr:ribonuclease HII [Candidatus Paceibacterota bacterium]
MKWVVGIDEVGRGPVAGPVYVCAVAMTETVYKKAVWPGLTDSKKMTAKAREQWHTEVRAIEKRGALLIAISSRSAKMIDKKGISACIRECIAECLEKLGIEARDARVLLDGSLKAPTQYKNQETIIKGDLKEKIISLASVVAKVERDHYMIALAKKHPAYLWQQNKGYGTKMHIAAIKKWGLTPFHRKSFLTRLS